MTGLSRIQDNVRSMIEQGAPSSDIDAYLKTEGQTPEGFAKNNSMTGASWQKRAMATETNPVQLAVNAIPDSIRQPVDAVMNTVGTGFTKGATGILGGADALGGLADRGATYLGDKVGMPEFGKNLGAALKSTLTMNGLAPNTEAMNRTIFGDLRVPEVNAADNPALTLTPPALNGGKINVGKMIDTGLQAIPGALALGGGALPAFTGGVTSEAAGQATAGTPYEWPARILGAFPGAMLGSRLTTPLPSNLTPQQQRAVDLAKANGVPLTVGQETGRGGVLERFLSRMPGGQGISERMAGKQGAATDTMALKQAGYAGNEIGQDTMKGLATQVGDEFNAAKNMPGLIDMTPTFPKVRGAVADYENIMDPAKRSPAVTAEANRFLSKEPGPTPIAPLPAAEAISRPMPTLGNLTVAIKNAGKSVDEAFDTLPGDFSGWFKKGPMVPMPKDLPELSNTQYQTMRAGLNKSIDGLYAAGDTNGARALQSMRSSLDDAAEASLGPDKLAAWQQARQHYYNFKVIEKAMNSGTGAARSEGTLGAAALDRALKSKQGDSYYRTTGGLNDVATIKGYLRDTFPNSGTPTIGSQLAAILNPITGFALGGANNLASRAMLGGGPISNVVRNYLANQAAPNTIGFAVNSLPATVAPGFALPAPNYPRLERRQ